MSMFYGKCSVCNCTIENMDEGICIKTYYLINNKPVCIDYAKRMKGRCPICGDVKGWCSHNEKEKSQYSNK